MATVDLATVAQPQEAAPQRTVLAPVEQWQKMGFASMRAWKSADNKKRKAATKAAKKEVAAVAAAEAAAAASQSALAALAAVARALDNQDAIERDGGVCMRRRTGLHLTQTSRHEYSCNMSTVQLSSELQTARVGFEPPLC